MSSFSSATPWIRWFLSQPQNEFLVYVDEEFIVDRFNLTGLVNKIDRFKDALEKIMQSDDEDSYGETTSFGMDQEDLRSCSTTRCCENNVLRRSFDITNKRINHSSMNLYGLIHARYIITTPGLNRMFEKFKDGVFGKCPRTFCRGFPLVPIGLSNSLSKKNVKMYCGHCEDIYRPYSKRFNNLDGAYFGTTFPHIFFQKLKKSIKTKHIKQYVPRIFGFDVIADDEEDMSEERCAVVKEISVDSTRTENIK